MTSPIVSRVTPERWAAAQAFERTTTSARVRHGDDYNLWWARQFEDYAALQGRYCPNVLEVGCGPDTNARIILPVVLHNALWLEDPLLSEYLRAPRSVVAELCREQHAFIIPEPLEDCALPNESMNLVICINVLDHVQDAGMCMRQMERILRPGGALVLGQDLSNGDDFARCPKSWEDAGHPIKLDEAWFAPWLDGLMPLYRKVLPREQGRNPRCHYGTLLFIGEKG